MKTNRWAIVLVMMMFSALLSAQLQRIVIAAGTPEDQALQAASNEQDPQKKLAMYQDFLQKFAANAAAVAYGNWQVSQYYQNVGDLQQALDYGDKALSATPRNLEILVSQASIAQQMKDNRKLMDYAVQGGDAYNLTAKETKPEGTSDQDFTTHLEDERKLGKSSYEFLEAAAYNAIANENNAKQRMNFIERFTPAFPKSRFEEPITSYALMSLSDLKDTARLISYGEKTLQANPNSLAALLLMAGVYVDDSKPGSVSKSVTYSQKAIEAAKADAPDADRSRKLSAGVAHSTLGYAYMKQDKTMAAVPELKAASGLLKGLDDQQYAIALYRLGFAYAKLNKVSEAREVLTNAVKIPSPVQQPSQDLLAKVNAARAKGR
jgi:tetratricopeptide (TPR) repeat protein